MNTESPKKPKRCAKCGIIQNDTNSGAYRRGKNVLWAAYCRTCESDRVLKHKAQKLSDTELKEELYKLQRHQYRLVVHAYILEAEKRRRATNGRPQVRPS